ncbi:vacuolar protein sorting-associated protein 13A-like protein, partial [Leptotrombidium deliense]
MVFESVFANLLNKYLSDFIDDVSASQLKLGALKGNIALRNLAVKPNAFDALRLPFHVIHGHVGSLVMKIPWMSLYTNPVIVELKDIFVVCVPDVESSYDEEYEEERIQAEKQKQLQNIDDAIKKAALSSVSSEKSDEPKSDDFVTKTVAQIVKNLEITIENVHIVYEDKFTCPKVPFAAGITLSKLLFKTEPSLQTTAKFTSSKPDNCIFKQVKLEYLSAYWNCAPTEFLSDVNDDIRDDLLLDSIPSQDKMVPHLNYILEPNMFCASSIINRKPEVDKFSMPFLDLDMVLDQLSFCFNRAQFESFLLFLDAINRIKVANVFRKWRPKQSIHENRKAWWKFAITAILETEIRRKNSEWNWNNIKQHRNRIRRYKELYESQLRKVNFTKENEGEIKNLEKVMDLLSIVMARNEAEKIVSEERKKQAALKPPAKQEQKGWFSNWWWGGEKESTEQKEKTIVDQFKNEMTAEEKLKFYNAIGYEESTAPTEFPPDFVAHLVNLNLRTFKFIVVDVDKGERILQFTLDGLKTEVHNRPASNGILLKASIYAMHIYGCRGAVLADEQLKDDSLLKLTVELNSLSKKFDYGLDLNVKTMKFVFDALTVNTLLEIVSPPEDVSFDELQSMASLKMNEFREMSVTGLEYAIDQHKQLNANINVEPSFIVVPEKGNIRDCMNVLLISLGKVNLVSHLIDKEEVKNIRKMTKSDSGSMISQYREKAYEKYALSVAQIQVLLSNVNRWKDDIVKSQLDSTADFSLSDRRLIEPISINLTLMRAIVSDDPEMPNMKVSCDIPSLYVKATDIQINDLISLATSIPTTTPKPDTLDIPRIESTSIIRAKQANDALKVVEMKPDAVKKIDDTQLTELHLTFSVGSMIIDLRTQEGSINKEVLKIKALSFGTVVEKKTFNLKAAFQLKEIKIEAFDEVHKSGNPFMFLETSQKSHLLVIKYEFCARNSPLFKDTIQEVDIKISEIICSVSRPVLTSVLVWSQNIVNRLPKSEPPPDRLQEHRPSFSLRTRASSFASLTGVGLKQKKVKPQSNEAELEVSNFAAFFEIECFYFHIESICSVAFKGFNCDLKLSASERIFFDASWQHFAVVNKISNAVMYEYIIQSESEKVLEMGVIMYPKKDVEQMKSSVDILVKVNFGRLKVVFLNRFVSELLSFLSVFEAAKAKAIDAGSAAAVYAKQSAVSAIESATKIGLHLVLEAPNIIIPRNWDSKQYVLLDLGKVVITNDIKSSSKLVLDTINCELTSTRIAVITDDSMQSLDNILAPISFSVKITRNLSFETNKTQPELNLSATLHDIQLNIAQCDLKLAMQILTENIAAGASVQTLQEPVRALENVTQRKTSNIAAITASNLHSSVIVEEAVVHVDADHDTLLEPIYVRFNFDFLLPRITLNLFDGNSKVDNAKLCELLLNELECYGVVRTNDTIHAGMSVSSVEVSDVRKGRKDTGIRKIVSTKQSTIPETDKTAKMLAISYTQQTDAFVDINMSGFTIILALDYLLHVTNVITAGLATQSEESESINKTQVTAAPTEISQNDEQEETTPTKQVGLMVVDCKMSRTDIVLIECIDRTDSPAVILNAFVEVGLKQQEERIHFTGKIANIQLGITNFEKYMKNNDDIEAYILKPTELNVVAAINGTTQHFDVMFNEIVLHISPNTVQLLLSILGSLGTTETKAKDDQASINDEKIDIKTFFAARKIVETDKYWFLKSHVCTAIEATEESFSTPSTPTPTNHSPFLVVQQVVLTLNKLSVVVESGGIDSQPMIKFDTSVSGNFDNWNKLNLTFTCFMDYYNEKLFVWEPMIEPVEKCNLWNFDLMLDIVNNGDSTATYNASIESKDRLELTLSKAALGVLMTCGDAFANAVKQSESLAHENLIVITNELGIDLYIFVSVAKFKCISQELQPKIENDMICLRIPSAKVGKFQATSTDPQSLESESDINFKMIVGNNQIERSISLKAKDKRCYNFPIVSYPGKEWKYLVDMSQRDSHTKNIVFHSTVEITNKFHKSLELYYTEEEDVKMFAEIKSKQQILLPLRLVYSPSQEIFVKPSNDYCTPLTSISCESKKGLPDYHIRLKQTVEDLLFEESQLLHNDSCCFKFELLPTFKLRNLLPVPVKYSFEGIDKQWSLGPGSDHDITHVDLKHTSMKIKIENYLNKSWSACQLLPSRWTTEDKIDVWTYTAEPNNSTTTMELAMNYSTSDIS